MTNIIPPPEDFTLTDVEKSSILWRKLKKFLEESNDRDRRKNDSLSNDIETTRNLRAMIAARKSLLDLDR